MSAMAFYKLALPSFTWKHIFIYLLFYEMLTHLSVHIGLLLQVVIFESGVKTPQFGLYGLAKALSQKGVARKIQVPAFTLL